MSERLTRAMLAGATGIVLGAVALSGAVNAQTAEPAASDQASLQGLEEITVTARRREEKLQSVPIAITALTGQDLREQEIQTSEELSHIVPSLSINGPFGNQVVTNLRLRGLPGVATYFAEVPTFLNGSSTSLSGNALFVDLENVQILKGPQGVAFGINTTGGAILFEPKRPTNNFEGYADVILGDYNRYELQSAVNVPVIDDKLLVRFAVDRDAQDGYTHDITDNINFGNYDYWYARASVIFRPTDNFENYTVADYYFSDDNGPGVILTYVNPAIAGYILPKLKTDLIEQKALGVSETIGVDHGLQPTDKQQNTRVLDIARWDVTDNFSIKNIASYSRAQELQRIDLDGSPENAISIVGGPGWGGNAEGLPDVEAFTEEFQLSGKTVNDSLQWIAGGFLAFNHPGGPARYASDVFGGLADTIYAFPANHGTSARTQAVYAQGIYDFSGLSPTLDGLKFTGGYRYNWDWRTAETTQYTGAGACATAGADRNCVLVQDAGFHAFGWTLGLDYQLFPQTLVYVRADRGYSAGGFNPYSAGAQYRIYQPEYDVNVELGIKSDWEFEGIKARTNFDAFHVSYTNIQRSVTVAFTNGAGGTSIGNLTDNAAAATVEGVEFEGTIEPYKGVELTPAISYIYSRYDKYITLNPTTLQPLDLSGQPFTNFPATQLSLVARYNLPIDPANGDVSIATTYSWQSHLYFGVSPTTVAAYEPAYDNLDVRVDWKNVMMRPIDLSFFMTNVANSVHRMGSFNLYESVGTVGDVYNPPRMFGFELHYRFGPNEPGLGL